MKTINTKDAQINERATSYLKGLPRIEKISDENISTEVLLFPPNTDLWYINNNLIMTEGLGKELDSKKKDLLTAIKIIDPLNVYYKKTNILMPRTYAESLNPIPHHISVQAIVLSRVTAEGKDEVLNVVNHTNYGKTYYDKIWIEDNDPNEKIQLGEILFIMNRRIGGWDGSRERPVIELLGGGGHLPTTWNDSLQKFQQMNPKDAIIQEFKEELGFSLSSDDVDIIGGFHNHTSNELVILCGVFVPFSKIIDIQNAALANFEENIDGIYLGTFRGTMKNYLEHAEPYAGGEKTKTSNFPSQAELMKKVYQKLSL